MEKVEKKERLKPLSVYGDELEEAVRVIFSLNPRKLKNLEGKLSEKKPEKAKRKNNVKG